MTDNDDDATYYLARAKQEDEAARNAANPKAKGIHRSLAERYRARVNGPGDGSELSVVRG